MSLNEDDYEKQVQQEINCLESISSSLRDNSWENFLSSRAVGLSRSIITLTKTKDIEGIPDIFRSFFETYINLLLIIRDKSFKSTLEYNEILSYRKFQTDQNLSLWGVDSNSETAALKGNKNRLTILERDFPEFAKEMSIENKLAKISESENGENIYPIYRLLCHYSHAKPYCQ